MLLNYLKLSLRLMVRNPFFTIIKISGLSIGLTVFVILWQYTQSELTSDQQWKDSSNIYRFGSKAKWTDDKVNWEEGYWGTNSVSLSEIIIPQYPEIIEVTRILHQKNFSNIVGGGQSYVGDHGNEVFLTAQSGSDKKAFKETNLVYADPNLFTFFGLPLIEGQPESALSLAGSVVLSEALAIKYFGSVNATGKTIHLNENITLLVTGVFENLPKNSHLSFDAVISSKRIESRYPNGGAGGAPVHYFKTRPEVDIQDLSLKINTDNHAQIRKAFFGDWAYGDGEIYLQPLHDMPFQSYILDQYEMKSDLILRILQMVAVAILLLAWINHVNLTCAANLKRMKEVLMRRVIGARAVELVAQFMVEAFVINAIALLLAITMVQLMKSPVEVLLGFYVLPWSDLIQSVVWILVSVFIMGVALTGAYPAWIVLRHHTKGLSGSIIQKPTRAATIFTTIQYTVAVTIIIFAFAIKAQLNFILTNDLGFKQEEIVIVDLPVNRTANFTVDLNSFINKVESLGPTVSRAVPGHGILSYINLIQPGVGAGIAVEGEGGVDEAYIPLYDIQMIEGRNFLSDNPADSASILLSEITASRLGFNKPHDAIGNKVVAGINGKDLPVTVVGVYADYKIQPLLNLKYYQSKGSALTYKDFLFVGEDWSTPQKVSFQIKPDNFTSSLSEIEAAYRSSFSDPLFNWYFLDATLNIRYQQHLLTGNQIMIFSLLALGIACIGLLGMMAYKAHEKVKEIGIRKVLGANLSQIGQLLLSATFRQILISSVIGIPAAYYVTQQYLENFSERMQLQWWHFVLPLVTLIVIMILTVSTLLWKAAKNNPVEALKYE